MTLSLPRWNVLRWPPRLGPLPLTSAVIALLVLLPTAQLHRYPRANAAGLERLLGASSLIQSFAADPSRPPPLLWQQRLGSEPAARLWSRQRGQWWQFWGREGGAYLAVPSVVFGPRAEAVLPPHALRLDDLVVIAPDPLSHQLLQQQLQRTVRTPQGMEQRCVLRLRQSQAVAWTNVSLAQLVGDLVPLLQRFQQGCLVVGSDPLGLRWQGEASDRPDPVDSSPAVAAASEWRRPADPLPPTLLLEVQGARLDLLLQALLRNQLISKPLEDRYGLDEKLLERLERTPFLLRLRPQPRGLFRASLELQLAVGPDRSAWTAWLGPMARALESQGLVNRSAGALPVSTWVRQDGTVVGGWRWITTAPGAMPELLFVLGAEAAPAPAGSGTAQAPAAGVDLRLRARPADLAALSLLPPELPTVVRRAQYLDMASLALPATTGRARLSRLWGSLSLGKGPTRPAGAPVRPGAPASGEGGSGAGGR